MIVGIGVLTLGALRQLALALPSETRVLQTSGPPIGARLPRKVVSSLEGHVPELDQASSRILAFITENCSGCQALLAKAQESRDELSRAPFALVIRGGSTAFNNAISQTGLNVIDDDDGLLWNAFEVGATPLLVSVDPDGRVSSKEVTHRVDEFARIAIPQSTSSARSARPSE
jgi:hypothetical protein